ncbi:ABC transporter ATP-binding protein [candidate division WOR-3 bacterium]|nr:ABC transporter ATP-binding protein [candidate division WOR-3 bacterium]
MIREVVLRVEGLRKRFGDVQALDGIDFTCRRGELFGLLGPNGAGKTTTIRCICSIIKPDDGSIEVEGVSVASNPLMALKKIGVVLEDGGLYERLTAEENMKLLAQLHGVDGSLIDERIDSICDTLGLDEYRKRQFKKLSKGNKQKILLGQALVIDPPLLILDEPTIGLDVPAQKVIRDLLGKIKKERTILYSTHIMSEAEELCDRLAIIDHGRIVAQGTVAEICRKAGARNLEQAFLKLVGRYA